MDRIIFARLASSVKREERSIAIGLYLNPQQALAKAHRLMTTLVPFCEVHLLKEEEKHFIAWKLLALCVLLPGRVTEAERALISLYGETAFPEDMDSALDNLLHIEACAREIPLGDWTALMVHVDSTP